MSLTLSHLNSEEIFKISCLIISHMLIILHTTKVKEIEYTKRFYLISGF